MATIPRDPVMLLSYVNTQLRDFYPSLEALCEDQEMGGELLKEKLASVDYRYDKERNQFV